MTQEQSRARQILYRGLMNVPHREYDKLVPLFREAMDDDPDFISRACVHMTLGGTKIRDQVDVALITLLQSPTMFNFREAGRVLLLGIYNTDQNIPGLPPYRIFRILDYIARSDRKIPRLAKSLAHDYLRMLEQDEMRFDGITLGNRKPLTNLYRHYHIQPSERAQAILFDNKPPDGSKSAVLKQIAETDDITEKAKLIVENKIPYRIASTLVGKMLPVVGVALVSVMSPTEALNSRSWVEQSGLLEIPEVLDAYTKKVAKATKSVASAEHRLSAQGSDSKVQEAVEEAKQKAVEQDQIEANVLLMVDRSSSMDEAIRSAVEFGSRIAPICHGELSVVYFNDRGRILEVKDQKSYRGWQQAFNVIRPSGMTSMGSGLVAALKAGYMPEKIVVITDGEENAVPFLHSELKKYAESTGIDPHIVNIVVENGRHQDYTSGITALGFQHDVYEYTGDYYLFDQIISMLGGPAAKSLIDVIMETELPRRVK